MQTADEPTLVYDGDCGFCTSAALGIAKRWRGEAAARSWQQLGPEGLARLGLTEDDVRRVAWWVTPDGTRSGGHAAVARALQAADGWCRPLGHLLSVPPVSWGAALVYPVVARYRHLLPGATGVCEI